MTKKFKSFGNGIISDNFYIGNNLTKHLIDIEVKNSTACIFTMPKLGQYNARVSSQHKLNFTSESGGIILPSENIH